MEGSYDLFTSVCDSLLDIPECNAGIASYPIIPWDNNACYDTWVSPAGCSTIASSVLNSADKIVDSECGTKALTSCRFAMSNFPR